MATVFFYAGLRLSELASARRGRLKVRTGKGDAYREVPLNSASRKALDEWFQARIDQLETLAEGGGGAPAPALW